MNLASFMKGLQDALAAVTTLLPTIKGIGGPAVSNLADLAATAASIGRNVLARVAEGNLVMSEPDQAKVKEIIDRLAAINDELAKEIAAS